MESRDLYHLELGSDRFVLLCGKLDDANRRDDASWSAEQMSGGFRFDDEFPRDLDDSPEVVLPLVTLLRNLWAYRRSLVEGTPRAELACWWEQTQHLAPHWAGFAPERCSPEMQPVVEEVKASQEQFSRDVLAIDSKLSRRSGDGPQGASQTDRPIVGDWQMI